MMFLQRPEETNVERLKELCRMRGKTEEFNIILDSIKTKFEGNL